MWILDHSDLPTTAVENPTGATLCVLDSGGSMAPLCVLDLQAQYLQPGIILPFEPTTQLIPVPTYTGDAVTISVADIDFVQVIYQNGISFTPAKNPNSPETGEFVSNSDGTVTIKTSPVHSLVSGLPVRVLGGKAPPQDPIEPEPIGTDLTDYEFPEPDIIPTDWVDSRLFSIFWNLPVAGEIEWNRNAENHPTASLRLRANRTTIAEVRQRFKEGTEFSFAGIGFSVKTYREKLLNVRLNPGGQYDIELSLTGKWDRKKYNRSSFYNPQAAKRLSPTSTLPYQDPDCSISGTLENGVIRLATKTSVQELAAQVNVPFVAYTPPLLSTLDAISTLSTTGDVKGTLSSFNNGAIRTRSPGVSLGAWEVPIPRDSSRDATTKWEDEARNRLRQNGCFIDLDHPDSVRARSIYNVSSWNYSVPELDWSNKGNCEYSNGPFGYAVEYVAAKLSGNFSEIPLVNEVEDSGSSPQSPPKIRWKRKDPNTRTLKSGDIDAAQCPPEIRYIKNMSLNADNSGRTTEVIEVTTENGIEMRRRRWVYGLVYTSPQVTNEDGPSDDTAGEDLFSAPAAGFWELVQKETTEAIVDDTTGYVLGSRTVGKKLTRFKKETDELELLGMEEDDPELPLYQFKWIPSISVEKKLLVQYAAFYADARREAPPFDLEKSCNIDGTSSLRVVLDPNYVRPMFEIGSRTYKSCFAATPNPDSDPPEDPLPDLTMGEEVDIYRVLQIVPYDPGRIIVGSGAPNAVDESKDLYLERTYETSAQGPQFTEIATRRTFSENEGRPSPAQRRQPLYEKEPYELNTGNPNATLDPFFNYKHEWILNTPGHDASEPSEGSVSCGTAIYFYQALMHVKTDYKVQDMQNSVDFSVSIPFNSVIAPFDLLALEAYGDRYATRVLSVGQRVMIQGRLGDYPLVVAPEGTKITAGIDREVLIDVTKRDLPKQFIAIPSLTGSGAGAMTLGDLEIGELRNRGNY